MRLQQGVSSDGGVAAVHQVVAAGDEGCVVAEKEPDEGGDLLGLTQSAQRMLGRDLIRDLRWELAEQGCRDISRPDGVDAYPRAAVVGASGFGQSDDAMLRRGVRRVVRDGDSARGGRHVDDGPTTGRDDRRYLVMEPVRDPTEVDRDQLVPV